MCGCGCGLALAMAQVQQPNADADADAEAGTAGGTVPIRLLSSRSARGWESMKQALRCLLAGDGRQAVAKAT